MSKMQAVFCLDVSPSVHHFSRMSWSRYSSFAPYVPVAKRREQAAKKVKQMEKSGKKLEPVDLKGSKIAATFWGKEWCVNLESYSDYSNRLPRGRTYVRNGSVIDLKIAEGKVAALVQGSSLYTVTITIAALTDSAWGAFKKRCAGKISSLLDLLQGRLDKGVLEEITSRSGGLFPSPREIKLSCSCPDGASMCKHVAATLYGVGARLDGKPELFFTLRGADMQELITAATANAAVADTGTTDAGLAADDLSAIFGVEIEGAPLKKPVKKAVLKKPVKKAKVAAKKAVKKEPAKKRKP